MRSFGSVTVGRVRTSSELRRLLAGLRLDAEAFVVKPSWYSPHPANYTDAEALRMLLEALDGRVFVAEAYTLDRQDGGMRFEVDGERVDYGWVLRHPDWGWIKEDGRWDALRAQDRWFLDAHGFTDLFAEFGVEYVNVTEEIWQGRVAEAGRVKEAVETRFAPVSAEGLYGCVPRRLYELRSSPLISLGRVKGIRGSLPSLSMKNLFGLIPDPLRSWWHGPGNERLGRSIVDINKVYHALFDVYGVCEALRYATVSRPDGEVKVPWGSYGLVEGRGFAASGRHLVTLDAVLCGLMGVEPGRVPYLRLGARALGPYEERSVEEARRASAEWFPV